MNSESRNSPGARQVLRSLRQPRVLTLLMLGFASGLPFMLVGNTLGYWLKESGIELSTIGFLSWVGVAYSAKVFWSPLVDRLDVPLLGRWLGRRRGWIAVTQLLLVLTLVGATLIKPTGQEPLWAFAGDWISLLSFGFVDVDGQIAVFGLLILIAAIASATQDVVIDALRIESASDPDDLGLLTAASQLGYRTALLLTDALILVVAADLGWELSYQLMAVLMGIGLWATWRAIEPVRMAPHGQGATGGGPPARLWVRFVDAIVGPFVAFFRQHRAMALLMLAAISLYRLADFVMGPMANPMYADLGLDKALVGEIRASIGLMATFLGIGAAGVMAVRFGSTRTLLVGAVLGPGSNLAFAWLAWSGADLWVFGSAMAIDNFSAGFAGTALVTYMSSLTSIGYTATQYALLSSFYALLGKVLKGFSGVVVEALQARSSVMDGYALFFIGTALIGLPAVVACLFLVSRTDKRSRSADQAA